METYEHRLMLIDSTDTCGDDQVPKTTSLGQLKHNTLPATLPTFIELGMAQFACHADGLGMQR